MWFIFIYLCFAYLGHLFYLFCDTRLWKVHYIVYHLLRILQENCLLNVSSDYSQQTRSSLAQLTEKEVCFELVDSLIKYILTLETPGAILIFLDGWNIIFKLMKYLEQHPVFGMLSVSHTLGLNSDCWCFKLDKISHKHKKPPAYKLYANNLSIR